MGHLWKRATIQKTVKLIPNSNQFDPKTVNFVRLNFSSHLQMKFFTNRLKSNLDLSTSANQHSFAHHATSKSAMLETFSRLPPSAPQPIFPIECVSTLEFSRAMSFSSDDQASPLRPSSTVASATLESSSQPPTFALQQPPLEFASFLRPAGQPSLRRPTSAVATAPSFSLLGPLRQHRLNSVHRSMHQS